MRKGLLVLVALVVMSFSVFAQDAEKTIAEIVIESSTAETPEFATLLTAVLAADPAIVEALSNPEAELTVFAPTDAAFAALAEALGEEAFAAVLADQAALSEILLYHVASGVYDSATVAASLEFAASTQEAWGMLSAVTSLETLQGQSLDFEVVEGEIMVDNAKIVATDIQASNGVIHVIDAVVLPEARTIADIVVELSGAEEPEFTQLLAVVGAAGLVEAVADPEAELTVFAPTDAAFAALSEALGAEALATIVADPEQIGAIVGYHVVPGTVSSTALGMLATMGMGEDEEMPAWLAGVEEGVVTLNTLNGATLSFSLDLENGLFLNETIRIVSYDVDASNGVIHVIDAVLVPAGE